jgi:hypothetical protein
VRELAVASPAKGRLLTCLREVCKALSCVAGAEICGLLVPLSGEGNVRRDTDDAELFEDKRVVCRAERQRGVRVAGLGGAPQQKARRGDIAAFQEICPSLQQPGDLSRVLLAGRTVSWR